MNYQINRKGGKNAKRPGFSGNCRPVLEGAGLYSSRDYLRRFALRASSAAATASCESSQTRKKIKGGDKRRIKEEKKFQEVKT
ncbi:hypothetical protein KKA93_00570 [Patescibacteria group bacterium]|nr:hypothetical protein [Patescibacteria group bacterium]MBU1662980.1 hypothetical protein [Patescibacteria group bacterium]MBU1933958.1 hypothetical protein [Patescibacteria group bacterium]MBU2008185.1 hypothetical protein [Patescibacteria group bacterium]MBU2233246.1 hypothetical protein [Patescibacteria group bacterium]